MKLVMTQAEFDAAIKEQGKTLGDVIHYRDLDGCKWAIVDHKKWDQVIDIEVKG